jgi:hypothetical protein
VRPDRAGAAGDRPGSGFPYTDRSVDGHMLVEVIFMLVILKIPVIYLCAVVWWAVRAEPRPLEGAANPARLPEPCPWSGRSRGRRLSPCGGRRRAQPAVVRRARPAVR